MVDPISDMLTRIRNAQAVGHKTVEFPYSKIKFAVASILSDEKYLGSISKKGKSDDRKIEVVLKYKEDKRKSPAIGGLKKISKSGQRIYVSAKELGRFAKQKGITILSTSSGIMTAKDAKKKGIGGEVLCTIW